MRKKIILSAIISLFLIGCGTSDDNNSQTTPSAETNENMSASEISQKYTELAIIIHATKDFCENNKIRTFVKTDSRILNYFIAIKNNTTAECSDFGKTAEHCDEYIAENEPGNTTCLIAYNLK